MLTRMSACVLFSIAASCSRGREPASERNSFASESELAAAAKASERCATPPDVELLRRLPERYDPDRLPFLIWARACVAEAVSAAGGRTYDDHERDVLTRLVPAGAAEYYAMHSFAHLWGNGGMQQIVLGRDERHAQWLLDLVARAYDRYQQPRTAALIREVRRLHPTWIRALSKMEAEGDSVGVSRVLRQIDAYDRRYDEAGWLPSARLGDPLLRDVRENPMAYTRASTRTVTTK